MTDRASVTVPSGPMGSGDVGIADPQPGTRDEVPRRARWFVRAFLAVFLASSIFGIEWWPLTGFRLFSRARHETRVMWVADTVAPDGRETPLWPTDLPRAYQGFGLIMGGFWRLSPPSKAATCAAFLYEARRVRGSVTALRIYRLEWHALPRDGVRPEANARSLTYACG